VTWTGERKLRAVIDAPCGLVTGPPDMRVIERDGWFQRIAPSSPGTWLNEVIISRIADVDAERVIDEVLAMYRAIGKPAKWCTGPWTAPNDFDERLTRRGSKSWVMRGMGVATDAPISSSIDVTRIDHSSLDAYVETGAAAWSLPVDEVQREAFSRAMDRELVAFVAGDLGAGAILLREEYGYLVGTAVKERARGRGVYRALVAARLAFLRQRGIAYAVTQARESTSAPILEHLGFETLFRGRCHVID
jgi:ribosomal protein S18 acetylase RimI-like enzyme